MKKKFLAILVFVLVMTLAAPLTVFADGETQEDEAGVIQPGWIREEYSFHGETYETWYYADSSGNLVTGWQYINGKWYYFDKAFRMYADGVYEIGSKHYYFYPSGAMGIGWIAYTYDFGDGTDHTIWYYADSSGALISGWRWINGAWYYFYPNYYAMV
ncbi:MAG: hypothetical protein IKN57_08035, partial [Parasporobacterium sp.]|nr:hypothetical protein [Parasporobacterium sp.]